MTLSSYHMFFLSIIWTETVCKYTNNCKILKNDVIDTFSSEEMENISLRSRMWFRMNFTSGVFQVRHYQVKLFLKARNFNHKLKTNYNYLLICVLTQWEFDYQEKMTQMKHQ